MLVQYFLLALASFVVVGFVKVVQNWRQKIKKKNDLKSPKNGSLVAHIKDIVETYDFNHRVSLKSSHGHIQNDETIMTQDSETNGQIIEDEDEKNETTTQEQHLKQGGEDLTFQIENGEPVSSNENEKIKNQESEHISDNKYAYDVLGHQSYDQSSAKDHYEDDLISFNNDDDGLLDVPRFPALKLSAHSKTCNLGSLSIDLAKKRSKLLKYFNNKEDPDLNNPSSHPSLITPLSHNIRDKIKEFEKQRREAYLKSQQTVQSEHSNEQNPAQVQTKKDYSQVIKQIQDDFNASINVKEIKNFFEIGKTKERN